MSQWDTHWGALSNQNAALLVLPSSNNPHDKIGIFNGRNYHNHTLKQHIGNTIKISMHDIKVRTYVVVVFDNEPLSAAVTQLQSRLRLSCN